MKKLIAVICALAMLLTSAALADAPDFKTLEKGKLIISTSPDFPPFEYTDDADNVIGIEPELIALICEKIGLTPDWIPMDFDAALVSPQTGKTDIVVSGVTVRDDRRAMFDFTDTYVSIHQAILVKEGSEVNKDNLGNYLIGVQTGTTGHIYAEEDYGSDHVAAYDKYGLAVMALRNGQVDCILMDDMVAQAYAKRVPGLVVLPTDYEQEDFAFGLAKGHEDLLAAINAALKELIEDGTVEEIIVKYQTAE